MLMIGANKGMVVCFCADWCSTCREFRDLWHILAHHYEGVMFRWIDVEDEPDWLGDIEIESFPTIVVIGDGTLRFAGGAVPNRMRLMQLIDHGLSDASAKGQWPTAWRSVAQRLWVDRL